jgi:Ion channel
MLSHFLWAWCLIATCVVTHAIGVASAVRFLRRQTARSRRFWSWTWLFARLAGWMILLHLIEITVFALFYGWKQAMPDLPTALYFSAVTYTTTGYGDVILPSGWRLIGGVEALTGILMCGWSTAFFFAIVSRMFEATPARGDSAPESASSRPIATL